MSANSFANCVHLILNDTTGHTSSASTSYFMRLQWGRIESFFSPPLHIYLHIISSHQRRQWALHGHPWLKKRKKPRVRESKKRGNRCQKENNMQEEEAGWIRVSETESTSIKIWCALASSEEASLWQLCPNSTPFPVGYNSSIFDSSHESLLEKKNIKLCATHLAVCLSIISASLCHMLSTLNKFGFEANQHILQSVPGKVRELERENNLRQTKIWYFLQLYFRKINILLGK